MTPPTKTDGGAGVFWWGSLTAPSEPPRVSEMRLCICMNHRGGARRTATSEAHGFLRAESRDPVPAERPEITQLSAWMYILRLLSGSLYPGATRNLDARLKEHFRGSACRTTKLDPPVCLLYSEEFDTLGQARKRENQIKRWSRAKKEALIRGDLHLLRTLSKRCQP